MWTLVIAMLVILVLAALVVLYVAFPHRGEDVPAAPWLGDESSNAVATHYMRRAMEAPDSSYQSLLAYRDVLTRIHDTLQRMEDEYRRRDHDASTDLGRRA